MTRVERAVRDLAVFEASSNARRPWSVEWEQVADGMVVELTPSEGPDRGTTCRWAVPSEGISGCFDVDDSANVVAELARRVSDLGAELWRA